MSDGVESYWQRAYAPSLRLVLGFYDFVIEDEAKSCNMRIVARGIESIGIATEEMDGGGKRFRTCSTRENWDSNERHGFSRINGRIVAKYKLTRDQIFFMNWLFKWRKEIQELYESRTEFTREDLEALVETCKEDHEDMVPYPQDVIHKSASKEGTYSST